MEIQQLKGFQAVARHGNFTIAAQKMRRTQPTISLQVKALEDELGIKLFERMGQKKVKLTAEGRLLLDLSNQVVEDFESILPKFQEALGDGSGTAGQTKITVVTHRAVMLYCLPQLIKKFKTQFPRCQLVILNRNREEIIAMLNDGEADCGISSLSQVPASIEYRVFSKFNRILIASKKHPLSRKRTITLEDLAKYPLILPNKESHTRQVIDRLFKEKGIEYQLTMEVAGRDAIKTYVGMDLGISIMNEYFVSPEDRKKLFIRDMSSQFGKSETGVLTRRGRQLSKAAQQLIGLIMETKN